MKLTDKWVDKDASARSLKISASQIKHMIKANE